MKRRSFCLAWCTCHLHTQSRMHTHATATLQSLQTECQTCRIKMNKNSSSRFTKLCEVSWPSLYLAAYNNKESVNTKALVKKSKRCNFRANSWFLTSWFLKLSTKPSDRPQFDHEFFNRQVLRIAAQLPVWPKVAAKRSSLLQWCRFVESEGTKCFTRVTSEVRWMLGLIRDFTQNNST